MEFLKSLVPAAISGEAPIETGPRLLRMKRLGLLAMGHTIEEDLLEPVAEVEVARSSHSNRTGLKGTTADYNQSN